MLIRSLVVMVASGLALAGCASAPAQTPAGAVAQPAFAHEASDIAPDPRVRYGVLPNGLRYAVMRNQTPAGTAALQMRFATGSINETDAQRGLAHFLEHMAFNGSANVPEGEMVQRLERHGLAFGADTNAHTSFDETVYKLTLPNLNPEALDEAFFLMRETAENLSLDADAINRERGVIASEKRSRDTALFRARIAEMDFLYEGSGLVDRLPIGVDETIATMPAEAFRAYYRGYYRPENTFIVFVGDFDPADAEARIVRAFGDWRPTGEALPHRVLPAVSAEGGRRGYFHDPEIETRVVLSVAQPFTQPPDSVAHRREAFVRSLGFDMLNRRLERIREQPNAPFLTARATRYGFDDLGEGSMIQVRSEPQGWPHALAAAEQELRRALEHGFEPAELRERLAAKRMGLEAVAEAADTRPTITRFGENLVSGIRNAFANERVFSNPRDALADFETAVADLTMEEVLAAFREAWAGADRPNLFLTAREDVHEPEAALSRALEESRAVAVTAPAPVRDGAFAYTDFGAPGTVVSATHVEDLGVELIRFANSVTLNLKHTDFERGRARVAVRVGDGIFSAPRRDEALRRLAVNLLANGGLEAHSHDEVRTLMAGEAFLPVTSLQPESDAIELHGRATQDSLDTLLNLMTAQVTAPGFRPEARDVYEATITAWFPTHDATPGSVAQRYIPRLIRSGDERFGYPDLDAFLAANSEEAIGWLKSELAQGVIEINVVGDFDRDQVVAQVARTFGALPQRPDRRPNHDEMRRVAFPDQPAGPVVLHHAGDANQALLRIYWPAPDASDPFVTRRVNVLRAIFRNRLTEIIREREGASYSPGVGAYAEADFPDYGYIVASVEVTPEDLGPIEALVKEIAADIRAGNFDQDEFERAHAPILEDIAATVQENGYWVAALQDAQFGGDGLEGTRSLRSDYETMTLRDLQTRAAVVALMSRETKPE